MAIPAPEAAHSSFSINAAVPAIFQCSEAAKNDIHYMISTLAEKSLAALLLETTTLMKIGDRIRPVHPLKFLAIILSDPELKADLQKIKDDKTVASWNGWSFSLPWIFDSFSKWSYFIKELCHSLQTKNSEKEESSIETNLLPFIQEAKLDVSEEGLHQLHYYIHRPKGPEWENFILCLMNFPSRASPSPEGDEHSRASM